MLNRTLSLTETIDYNSYLDKHEKLFNWDIWVTILLAIMIDEGHYYQK